MGKRGQYVFTDGKDEEHISKGVYNTFTERNLRYSQVAPLGIPEHRDLSSYHILLTLLIDIDRHVQGGKYKD